MVVQHNITAMNASRQLGIVTGQQAKQSEKLASGYRINRAGDDAAGLKISEKMRSQIRGLQKASSNAQDGVSLIQTAEGALNEAHSILQRMNELAVQGANDTNTGIDRDAINEELNALTAELDRIASTTQFNKQNLLDGSFTARKLQVGANTNQSISITVSAMNATAIGVKVAAASARTEYEFNGNRFATAASANAVAEAAVVSKTKFATSDVLYGTSTSAKTVTYNHYVSAGGTATFKGTGYDMGDTNSKAALQAAINGALTSTTVYQYGSGAERTSLDDAKDDAKLSVATVNIDATSGGNVTVSSYSLAQEAISRIQEAINKVSGQRSALGALQNRLEHTIANLDNVAENTQAAESRIRDTDMAAEMVEYSKNQILAQAGQSMLAQANQSTQGVLSLLQ